VTENIQRRGIFIAGSGTRFHVNYRLFIIYMMVRGSTLRLMNRRSRPAVSSPRNDTCRSGGLRVLSAVHSCAPRQSLGFNLL